MCSPGRLVRSGQYQAALAAVLTGALKRIVPYNPKTGLQKGVTEATCGQGNLEMGIGKGKSDWCS